jgi:hypothetical protein
MEMLKFCHIHVLWRLLSACDFTDPDKCVLYPAGYGIRTDGRYVFKVFGRLYLVNTKTTTLIFGKYRILLEKNKNKK